MPRKCTSCTRPILHGNQFVSFSAPWQYKKLSPKKVTRCEYCKILFTYTDIILFKTKHYLHYLQSFLKVMMISLDLRVLLSWRKWRTGCLKVLARGSQKKTCKWKNKGIVLFLETMWIHWFMPRKDNLLDKYKFKVQNRYSSWIDV